MSSLCTLTGALRRGLLAAAVVLVSVGSAAAEPVRFGIQPWPGVTVKTEVAARILEAIGYDAEISEYGSSFIYQGMRTGDVDVSLGAWMPAHEEMLRPVVEAGAAKQLSVNLEGAVQGLAVPVYTWEAGVHSVEDLVANGDAFERTIYAIEPGAGMTRAFRNAVEEDYQGLGDWEVVPSSTAGMLAQVERAVNRGDAIVFHGWKPHWMAVKFDIRFLDDGESSPIADMGSTVYTIVATEWADANPQPVRFLEQMQVSPEVQSQWIYEFSYEEKAVGEVADSWISNNLDLVTTWLEGVQAADGGSAIEAVRAAYGS
jgi:glycine betaine/proline transport system substrate-binding protein